MRLNGLRFGSEHRLPVTTVYGKSKSLIGRVVVGPSHRAYDCSRSPCAAGFPFHKVSSSHLADHHFFFGRAVLKKSFGVQNKSMVAVIVSCFFESQLQLRCHHKAWLQSLFLVNSPEKKSGGVGQWPYIALVTVTGE